MGEKLISRSEINAKSSKKHSKKIIIVVACVVAIALVAVLTINFIFSSKMNDNIVAIGEKNMIIVKHGVAYNYTFTTAENLNDESYDTSAKISDAKKIADSGDFKNENINSVDVGYDGQTIISQNGTVFVWNVLHSNSVPTKVSSNDVFDNKNVNFVKLSDNGSSVYTYYALKNGTIYAWGINDMGQLGDNSTVNSAEPVKVKDANGFVNGNVSSFDAKFGAVLAIAKGTLYTWGQLTDKLGESDLPTSNIPIKFEQNTADGFRNKNVSSASIGGTMSYAVEDGTCYYWGPGLYGEDVEDIGDYKAKPLVDWSANNSVKSVKTSNEQAALLKDGHIWTLGYGELGSKTVDDYTYVPKVVPANNEFTNSNIKDYWVGYSMIAVLQGDDFYLWGYYETDDVIALFSHKPIKVNVP